MGEMSAAKRTISILWAAFLMAAVLEMVVFALVDPADLRWLSGEAVDLSARAIYTLAFMVFWAVTAVAAALALLLCRSPEDINRNETIDALPH